MTSRNPLKRSLSSNGDSTSINSPPPAKKPCVASSLREPAPLSKDLAPPVKRVRQITYEQAVRGTEEPVRVYADGVYDMFHKGHARGLLQVKQTFPNTYLIVGVVSDELTHKLKGKTVCNQVERYDALRHCRYVDEVITDAPWTATLEFLDEHQIDFVAHDDCNNGKAVDNYKPFKDLGKFVTIERKEGVCSSDLIARVIRDYDMYVSRNLSRGYTTKDLNVGFMKEKEVKFKERMGKLREKVGIAGDKIDQWEDNIMSGFLGLFGRDGRLSEFFLGLMERLRVKNRIT